MTPLPAAIGASESASRAARRLADHQAAIAPVVSGGRAAGLLTREAAEALARHGPPDASARDGVAGPAPMVGLDARLPAVWRAARGTSPGVIVRGPGGAVRGVIDRGALAERAAAVRRVSIPRWLDEPDLSGEVRRLIGSEQLGLLAAASRLARRHRAPLYLVGGIVRDLLRGRPGRDLDLVVEGDAIALGRELAALLGARAVAHAAFGTLEVRLPSGHRLDVITARHETYAAPGSLPVVAPGTLADDLMRRDVTVNAMAIRLDGPGAGRLRDDLGGRRDLRARRLRVHHMMSLLDDPTRAFRIARLAGRLRFTPAEETWRSLDLARRSRALEAVSGARIVHELALAMREPDPGAALAWMARLGLPAWIGGGLAWDRAGHRALRSFLGLRDNWPGGPAGRSRPELILLLLMASGAGRSQRRALASRLALSPRASALLADAPRRAAAIAAAILRAPRLSRVEQAFGSGEPEQLALVWSTGGPAVRRVLADWMRRRGGPGVNGGTLRDMGLRAGPAFGRILRRIRAAWLDGEVRTEAQALAMAHRLVRSGRLTAPESR